MAQSTAGGPSVSTTECRIGIPATDDEARECWILGLEACLGAMGSQGVVGDRPVRTRTGAQFAGTVLTQTGVDVRTGASVNGRLQAQTAVNLEQATVSV